MAGTEGFELSPPTKEDLDTAEAAWNAGRTRHAVLKGSTWWRALRAPSEADAHAYAETCFASPNEARFSPVQVAGHVVPAAYAGSTPETALWELVLRGVRHEGRRRVPRHETLNRWLVELTLDRDLTLLTTRRPYDSQLVAEGKRAPELSRAWPHAYGTTRQWAQELVSRIPAIDGLLYESHQLNTDCAILYQSANPKVFSLVNRPVRVDKEPVRSMLKTEAGKAGAVVDFYDPDP